MRHHGSLTKDAETNEAAWEAARGATVGAAKVRGPFLLLIIVGTCSGQVVFEAISVSYSKFQV